MVNRKRSVPHLATFLVGFTALAAVPAPARAESVRTIDLQGFSRLLDGDAQSTSLSEDGAIGIGLKSSDIFSTSGVNLGTACLWRDDVVAVQTGEATRVLAIDGRGQQRVLLGDLGGHIVTRMVVRNNELVVATAPKPEITTVTVRGTTQVVAVPDVGFVWDMLPVPDGALLVATGEPGRIMKLDRNNTWTTLFEAEEAHIKALAFDPELGLFAGGGQRGIVYHGTLAGNMRALYDSGNTEVTALTIDGKFIYAATVTGAQAAVAPKGDDGAPAANKPEVRSAVARIGLDGAGELLAGSADEIIFDVVRERPGSVLLATGAVGRKDARGRLYRLNTVKRNIALLHQSRARRLTQLLVHPSGKLMALGQDGTRITLFSAQPQGEGVYVSPAFDTGVNSTFGAVQALGTFPKGSSGTLSVRSGQTPDPDNSWSPWGPMTDAQQLAQAAVPPGRFAQVRLRLRGKNQAQPEVLRLRLSYLRQNIAPFVRDIGVLDKGLALSALPGRDGQDDSRQKIVVLGERPGEESGGASASEGRKAPARARQSLERGALTVRWVADDANGDDLSYTLWMRPLEQTSGAQAANWQLLADKITDSFFTLQSPQLADGYYLFRVRVSDARSNPAATARQDERISRPILVDNTPPQFARVAVRVRNHRAFLEGEVSDAAGLVTQLQVSVDGEPLRPWAPLDGVLDGPKEKLDGDLGEVAGGAHTLTIVAQDEAQNDAYTTLTFTAPLGK